MEAPYLMDMRRIGLVIMTIALVGAAMSCDRDSRPDAQAVAAAGEVVQQKGTEAGAADQPGEEADEDSDEKGEKKYYYSPFAVELESETFDVVSFKDVGIGRSNPRPNDPILEAISQSFLYEVRAHDKVGYDGEVVYDKTLLDPSNHLHCEKDHLYVDVWRAEGPDRWGYSMWSGCSQAGQFEWKEIELDGDPDKKSLVEEVTPLGRSIADSLAKASEDNCFTRSC